MARQRVIARRLAFRIGAVITVLTILASAAEDLERARAMFGEALVLEVAGDWAAALTKFQQVAQTRLTPQVRYHLARCKEHLGRLTEALGDYRVAETEARAAGLTETVEMERARRDLEGRVPTILLRSNLTQSGISVELDGIELGPSVLNQPMVVDPGEHRIIVRGSNAIRSERIVSAVVGQLTEVELGEARTPPVATKDPHPVVTKDHAKKEPDGRAPPVWSYISAGIGTAAIASSVALFIIRGQAMNELNQKCDGEICDSSLKRVQERGEMASIGAPIALGLGVAGLGLAAWGFWGRPHRTPSKQPPTGASIVVSTVGPAAWGIHVRAAF